jgi:hypothetical protein
VPPNLARRRPLPAFRRASDTPDGKCHFNADTLDYQPPVESRHGDAALNHQYPLELISPKTTTA